MMGNKSGGNTGNSGVGGSAGKEDYGDKGIYLPLHHLLFFIY